MSDLELPYPVSGKMEIDGTIVTVSMSEEVEWISEHEHGDIQEQMENDLRANHMDGTVVEFTVYGDGSYEFDQMIEPPLPETSDYLKAAADSLNDARTDLGNADARAPTQSVAKIVTQLESQVESMEDVLRELAVNSEVIETVEDDEQETTND